MSDEKWHYEYEGRRIGPVSADLIIEYIKDKALDGDSLIWCDDFDDWQTVKSTDFKKYIDQNIPPPLSYELVNNNFAWLIAFVPIIGIIFDLFLIRKLTNESFVLYEKFSLILFLLIYTILSWIDSVKLQNAGYDSSKFRGFIWLIPVYLYQREVAVKSKNKIIFFTWLLTFILSIFSFIYNDSLNSNPKFVSSQSSVQTAKTTPKDTVSQNKINPVQLEKDSNDGLDIELNNVKFDLNPYLSTCQFFFTIINNTDYNITGFYSSGFLKDKNGSVISQIMQTDVVGRLKKGEENIVSFAFVGCKESDIKDLDSVSINFATVSVNGEIFSNFDSVIRGKRTSRVPNIKNI